MMKNQVGIHMKNHWLKVNEEKTGRISPPLWEEYFKSMHFIKVKNSNYFECASEYVENVKKWRTDEKSLAKKYREKDIILLECPLSGIMHYISVSNCIKSTGIRTVGCFECRKCVGSKDVSWWISLTRAERKAGCPHCTPKIKKEMED
jgi:hypothetical protein